jgi:hypothetical protein
MTARTRSRNLLVGAAVVALLAPLAIVLGLTTSASAAVGPRRARRGLLRVLLRPGNKSEWHFRMENFADGHAQVKLFLT